MADMTEIHEGNKTTGPTGLLSIQDRLQKRHQARIEEVERRKEANESHGVAEEQREFFSSTFNSERATIEELLSSCSGADRDVKTRRLEEATAKTAQLQKFLNDSMTFLRPYDLRQAQAALQTLQTSLAETREEGRAKFAFRSRNKKVAKKAPISETSPDAATSGITKVDAPSASEQCGFSNMSGVVLTKTAEEIQKQDVLLTHLSNCKVRLVGSPSTLHLKHIDSCEILCGPVSGSVFIDHCKNSTLAVPCQQLRTHNTSDTQVYLHVTSRAIIEDCRRVSFAPFSWSYPTLEEDFNVSGLDQKLNNWNQVDDFNWLTAGTPSPNWTVIPEAERKSSWDA